MKKIISLLLTVVMLITMIVIPAGAADGNAAIHYNGLTLADPDGSWFQQTYCYLKAEKQPYIGRVNESGAAHYGGFNYYQVFDFKIDNYAAVPDLFTEFAFTSWPGEMSVHYGYSFTRKAFVVYDQYIVGGSLSQYPATILAEMQYDLALNTWHEMGIRFLDKTITIYLDGVEMLSCDLDVAYTAAGLSRYIEVWDWQMREKSETAENDMLFISGLGVEYHMDNIAFYSGDYDIATGTASETYATDSDFTSKATDGTFCGFSDDNNHYVVDPNGGTEKVTYDRETAAGHVHNMQHDASKDVAVGCTNTGYEYYYCANGCGATAQMNTKEPLGHLPGQLIKNIITATETESGVEYRQCTRAGCGKFYTIATTLLNPTTNSNKAAHMYPDGTSSMYNGYLGVGDRSIMAAEDGFTLTMDIMPLSQVNASTAKVFGRFMVGNNGDYTAGYDYNLGKFYITDNSGNVVSEKAVKLNDFEWKEWAFVRKGLDVALYIDGEVMVSATINSALIAKADGVEDEHGFVFLSPCTEILLDNVILAGSGYDLATDTGIVYDEMDFNDGGYVQGEGYFISPKTSAVQLMAYSNTYHVGWKLEAYGLPADELVKLHEDRALKVDCDYSITSVNAYSQLNTEAAEVFTSTGKFEYTFDFYAYDWCTDPEILKTGSAFIGGHINNNGVGNENSTVGNGFAGYDFIKQQAVIGCISGQAGGHYGENTQYVDYAIAKNEWHNFKISYDLTGLGADGKANDNSKYVISVSIDGEEIISRSYGYYDLDVEYYIFFPNFVKGYLDNVTVKVNGVVYEDSTDYTNDYSLSKGGMEYARTGVINAWSVVAGGVPTHTYSDVVTPASCLTDGYTTHTCACGESSYITYDQKATGHAWNDGVVETPATGTSTGVMLYTCTVCGETKTEEIPLAFAYGDVNGDGAFNATDLSSSIRKSGGANVSKFNSQAADVAYDGTFNSKDITSMWRKSAGANVTFGPVA